ncbi:LytTR family DNA-binding domain-containing protein [Alkalilacustris brevis]|uniref:LytTR family DNA-binding domain-containing protein n=1 Tax=Alkalilacustris brevis TaxID=2026338 RepID=UPI000E0D08AC|nr:LytTR family DNA-binding domain-containing protein [Alkalilacustris brevis]
MTDGKTSLALRELRAHLTDPVVLAVQAGVALVLAVSGPFGTFESLSLAARLLYWPAIVFGTYAIGAALTLLVLSPANRPAPPSPWLVLRGTVVVGIAVTAFVSLLNLAAFGWRGYAGMLAPPALLGTFLVTGVVLGIREIILVQQTPGRRPPPILARLPLGKRGALLALTAQDHYVEVVTENGAELVLMPLRDAIRLSGGQPGLRVHRSHWVALDAVTDARRRGDGAVLTLTNGLEIPVSRGHMGAVRRAGLIAARQER